jgi:hypothetical protein
MRSFIVVAFALVTLAAPSARANDEPDELLPGRAVIIKTGKLAKFVAKPPTGGTFDLPNSDTVNGNNPIVEGGQLHIFDDDPFTPASNTYALPYTGWKGLGGGASKGFKYSGAGSSGNPCRVVLVKAKVVKAVCKGPDVTLPTPFLGQVGIVLTVGTDSKRYCALFGGDETKNDGTLLKRKNADAPGACPLDLNSSTTIPPTTTSTSTTTTASGTVTTTSTSLPSSQVCCPAGYAGLPDGACTYAVPSVSTCLTNEFTGYSCDGATGGCVTTPASAGNCCQNSSGLPCIAGPAVTEEFCNGIGPTWTFVSGSTCTPAGSCVP